MHKRTLLAQLQESQSPFSCCSQHLNFKTFNVAVVQTVNTGLKVPECNAAILRSYVATVAICKLMSEMVLTGADLLEQEVSELNRVNNCEKKCCFIAQRV